jgi:beta-galactosidase
MVVADGEDVAMIRATLVDAKGNMVPGADNNISFTVESGPGAVWTTHK